MSRKYRILDVQWHIGHQYEMLKFPFVEWSWLLQYERQHIDQRLRGDLDRYIRYVCHYEKRQYDAAILHLDQECLHPYCENWGKGRVYRDMNSVILDIPKIVIMHGTPHFPEAGHPYGDPDWLRSRLKEALGPNALVVNSNQAARQWGIGTPVIHGMDADEWVDLPKVPRVVCTLSPRGMNSYYDRPFLQDVARYLAKRDIALCHIGVDYIPQNWDEYRRWLGSSLIYFNPTREAPMPRARTEAMLSGCCVVTTPHHDAESFIQDGKDGFLVNRDPQAVASLIESLIYEPRRAVAIGQEGKQLAKRLFDWNRFADNWRELLSKITGFSDNL